jgi:hypothetical protein
LHQDTGKVRSVFKPVVGDTKIEFYLAYKTPEGKPTNGIDRVKTKRFDFGGTTGYADAVKYTSEKGIDAWDPDKYLNIWVCNFTYNGVMAVSAYAYPPINAQFWNASYYKSSDLQGVVINYPFIGVGNPNDLAASSLRERTLVHEIGHYLGLRHIWADKQNTCTGEDDGIKDTPVCRSATTTCNPLKNTCIESTGDKPDMLENYMDYTPYPCTVMFTKQQSSLMKYNLKNLRPILYNLKSDQPFPSVYAKIAVAPNPALNNIRFIFEQEGEYSLKIFNMLGQPLNEEIFKVGNNYEYTSNAQLSSGVYHIKILSSQKILLQQQIIVR